ncbi:kinase [Aureococcus anophagefferens]|nr:kinase [Aureococcus anophagefferens]
MNLSTEERATLTRARNRLHAQSTRRRKKIVAEYARRRCDEILAEYAGAGDAPTREMVVAMLELDGDGVTRRAILNKFLELLFNGASQPSGSADLAACGDAFELRLPAAIHRARRARDARSGVEALAFEAACVRSFLDGLRRGPSGAGPVSAIDVECALAEDAHASAVGDVFASDFRYATRGLVNAGFPRELEVRGALRARFNVRARLSDLELSYDAGAVAAASRTSAPPGARPRRGAAPRRRPTTVFTAPRRRRRRPRPSARPSSSFCGDDLPFAMRCVEDIFSSNGLAANGDDAPPRPPAAEIALLQALWGGGLPADGG